MDDNKIIDFNKIKGDTKLNTAKQDTSIADKVQSNIIDLNEKETKKVKNNIIKEQKREQKKEEIRIKKIKKENIRVKNRLDDSKREVSLELLGKEKNNKNHNFNKSIFDFFIYAFCFLILIIIVINLPIFRVKSLNISGNNVITNDEIEELVGLTKNNNFLFLYFEKLDEKIKADPMIKDVKIRYVFPNDIIVKVEEIIISGYIPYLDEYVYIDSVGKVVDINDELTPNVPLIVGLNFSSFTLGNVLEVTNEESLEVIIELANIINKYMESTEVATIDISNKDDIRIISNKTEIMIGSMDNCDYKIRKAIEIIKKLPDSSGYLDVSSASNRSVFTFK